MNVIQIYRININFFRNLYLLLKVCLSKILVINLINAENLFYSKFILLLYIFQHYVLMTGKSKLYYTAFGIVTPVHSRPVHSPLSNSAPDGRL